MQTRASKQGRLNADRRQLMQKWFKAFYQQRYLHVFVLPAVIFLIIFKFVPIAGLQIAFKDYSFRKGISGSPWAGLKHFEQLVMDVTLWPAVKNTLLISISKLLIGFPIPIVFAILMNEMRLTRLKRTLQTISYFPHFIAYSVVALMLSNLLSINGVLNTLLTGIGIIEKPKLFLGDPDAFLWIAVLTDIWKTTGWNSIIYFAALTSVSPELYEAATIDGANRLQRILNITLPSILPTIVMLWILRVGSITTGANFDLSYLLANNLNRTGTEILPTYVLKTGISLGRFSYATAVGFIQSLVSLFLVFGANLVSNKLSGEGLF
ncbi:MAG: ABC transporter permease [Christensenellales bacterium]|jgi:putative aldouronate transport system permease protein